MDCFAAIKMVTIKGKQQHEKCLKDVKGKTQISFCKKHVSSRRRPRKEQETKAADLKM